jgi:hypothetical protein
MAGALELDFVFPAAIKLAFVTTERIELRSDIFEPKAVELQAQCYYIYSVGIRSHDS